MKHFLSHLFLPHESNNHRAKFLHHSTLVVILLVIFGLHIFTSYTSSNFQQVLGVSSTITSSRLLELTNIQREKEGLSPLKMNDQLSYAAQTKAMDMFSRDYWAHNSPEGTTPWVFVKGSGYDYLYAGENLARGFTTADDIVQAWMDSPGHRENLMSTNYEDIGFAIQEGTLTGDQTILVVQMFGKQKRVEPVPEFTNDSGVPTERGLIVTSDLSGESEITKPEVDVASVQSKPLIDMGIFSKVSTGMIIALLIGVLILDLIVAERRNIVRVLSHNLDHVIFLVIILVVVVVLGGGVIL